MSNEATDEATDKATISVLPEEVSTKIAAGEVVQSPVNIVKELIENSIDAGADNLLIEINEGGKSLIRISDNGSGMSREDVRRSLYRHATSKLKTEDDLFALETLGFRGEALASISAVSTFRLLSKQANAVAGTELRKEGEEVILEDVGMDKGTVVEVKDLFYNVPARKKFLKSILVEQGKIIDIITRYALCYPEIAFHLKTEKKTLVQTTQTNDLKETLTLIYSKEVSSDAFSFEAHSDLVHIHGYLFKPSSSRVDRSGQSWFINGRYVKSKELSDAVKEGYHSMLFLERQPQFVLHMDIDTTLVDVNVHPQKELIKISRLSEITSFLTEKVRDALLAENLVPDAEFAHTRAKPTHDYPLQTDHQATLSVEEDHDAQKPVGTVHIPAAAEENHSKIGPTRVLGQVNRTYIIAEGKEGLLLIDQHAAEERVNYELLLDQLKDRALRKQELLTPLVIELDAKEYSIILSYLDLLADLGYSVEDHGKNTILLRSVPFLFERPSKVLIQDLITELGEVSDTEIRTRIEDRIIRFSCKKSITAGDTLSLAEMERLLSRLDKCRMPFTCPHGRPTIVTMTLAELERKFKRSG